MLEYGGVGIGIGKRKKRVCRCVWRRLERRSATKCRNQLRSGEGGSRRTAHSVWREETAGRCIGGINECWRWNPRYRSAAAANANPFGVVKEEDLVFLDWATDGIPELITCENLSRDATRVVIETV